jgi:3-isopropylmalate dehydrogenase
VSLSTATTARQGNIVLLPGDGIGPEVVAATRLVLEAAASRFELTFNFSEALIGGASIDATGTALPAETIASCSEADAVLLGAVGGPLWDNPSARVRPEQGLLGIRAALGVFANLRPVRPFPQLAHASPLRPERLNDVDLVVVRELTGGIYFGAKECVTIAGGERASDVCTYSTPEVERIVRVAAELARGRRGRVTSVDKANVLETSRLWRRVATRVMTEEFPDVKLDHMLADNCAMRLVQQPADFDVIVTDNLFGDILTDEAAVLSGSIGLLPSASLGARTPSGRRTGLYEPIHGSAPDIAGRQRANPLGTILSAALMLRYSFGWETEACAIEDAVRRTIAEGVLTPDLVRPGATAATTTMVANRVAEIVAAATSPPFQVLFRERQ